MQFPLSTGAQLPYQTAEYHGSRTVQPGLLPASRLGQYSTVAGHTGYTSYLTPTLSGVATTTTGTLQPLTHVPSAAHAHSGQYHYIANPPSVQQQPSVTSPVTHPAFSSRQYTSMQYLTPHTVGGTLHLQPSVGYHNPVISTSAPAYTAQQPSSLPSIHPVTGTVGTLPPQTLPSYTAPDTFSSSQLHPQQQQQATQPPLTRPQWNAPSGF